MIESASIARSSLPAPLTSFVGREREVGEIADLLRGPIRLLTLVGPGGVGKTRLAIQTASSLAGDFPDGVWFVDLAPLTDPALVLPTVARAVGLLETGDAPLAARLTSFLQARQALLVIDNLEQVIAAAADLARLLADCPDIAMLVTSREPLAVGGEQQYPVLPLRVDVESEAARLFAERARAGVPGFALTSEVEPLVIEICRRLDGLPLAIELAAARIKTLPPAELLARLDQRLPLLTGTRRDGPQRHHTMRDAIAWSYDLLPPAEQVLFRRLSVFAGGFSLELAEGIAGGLGLDVLDGITSLQDKSLLRQIGQETETPRYGMLETVREYGLGQLQLREEIDSVRAEHADLITTAVGSHGSSQHLTTVEGIRRDMLEQDNVRAALRWALDTGGVTIGLRLATAYYWTWNFKCQLDEGRRWLTGLLDLETDATPLELRAAARWMHGWLAFHQGESAVAERAYREVLAFPADPDIAGARAYALLGCGVLATDQDDFDLAEELFTEAVSLARTHGGDPWIIAGAIENFANLAWQRGDYARAERLFEEDLKAARSRGDDWSIAAGLGAVSASLRKQGKFRRAATLSREHVVMCRKLNYEIGFADCCSAASEMSLRRGLPESAARLAGAAGRVLEEHGLLGSMSYQRERAEIATAIRAALGDDVFTREWAAGSALSVDDAFELADAVFAEEESAPELAPVPVDPAAAHGLTPREAEILRLLARDQSNQQIADALFLSRRTVHKHVEHILAKLEMDSRAGAAVWAVRHGIE